MRRPETQLHTHRAHGQRRWERGTWQGEREGGFVKREPGGEEENDAGGVPAKVE